MKAVQIVRLFDRVSVDGRLGTAVSFFDGRCERSVLVRFDDAEVLELPESRLVVESALDPR